MEYSLQNRYLYPFSYSIFIIQNKNPGCVLFRFFGRHNGIRHNDDFIAGLHQPGSGAVQADSSAVGFAFNHIGFKARSVIIVHDAYFFLNQNSALFEQRFIDGDAARVIEIGFRNGCLMKFCF